MMSFAFSIFADVMFWASIPIMAAMGIWEHHLILTDTDHKLVQILLVSILFGWAYLWNSLRERERLIHLGRQHPIHPKPDPLGSGITSTLESDSLLVSSEGNWSVTTNTPERYHVSDN